MLDIHNHILPNLDDGTRSLDEATEAASGLARLGFTDIVATPHFYPGKFTPSVESIDAAILELSTTLNNKEIGIRIHRGRECMLDFLLTTAKERETFSFTRGRRKYQLIELPSFFSADVLKIYVHSLSDRQITAILAHPERYPAVQENPHTVQSWREWGLRMQVDLLNLSTRAPERTRETATALLREGYADFMATDLHHAHQLQRIEEGLDTADKLVGSNNLNQFFTLDA